MSNKILCMYSGGLNSTGGLWELITNPKYSKFDILVHHINIIDYNNQFEQQNLVVKNIINTLQNLTDRNLYLSSSRTGFEHIPPFSQLPHTLTTCAFIAGNLAQIDLDIKLIALGANRTKINDEEYKEQMNQSWEIFKTIGKYRDYPSLAQFIYPVQEKLPQEILDLLPHSLQNIFQSTNMNGLQIEKKL